MNSFIFNFKSLLLAIIAIGFAEGSIYIFASIPQRYNTDLLIMAPLQKEKITRIFIHEKLLRLSHLQARFIQVGDSSGYYGIKPKDVVSQLKNKSLWLNFGCCARTGFEGYLGIFDAVWEKQNVAEYLVLALTPYYSPKQEFEDGNLAKSIKKSFSDFPPKFYSEGLRISLANFLYAGKFEYKYLNERTNLYWNLNIDELMPMFDEMALNHGWIPRPGNIKNEIPTSSCEFELEESSVFDQTLFQHPRYLLRRELEESYRFAKKRGLNMILVVNPVGCAVQGSNSAKIFTDQLQQFKKDFPDAIIPFPKIREYPTNLFKDKWHLTEKGAENNSKEIGQALGAIL